MKQSLQLCKLIEQHCCKHKRKLTGNEMSYKKLSELANVPVTTIQNWLYGIATPSLEKAELVLNAMGYELQIRRLNDER